MREQVKARKMVVLSSGTLGTPQILERSGVGNGEILKELGIKVVSDLPGVGCVLNVALIHHSTDDRFTASNTRTTTPP